jgi:hypothetical protein
MATMKPENIRPLCRVPGCKNPVQMYSIQGSTAVWMKTCGLHTYLDLPEDDPIETFWPPTDKKDTQ